MGYVEQADVHSPLTTVGEALRFAAALRLPAGAPAAVREGIVRRVMGLVELAPLEGRLVGMPGGLSKGMVAGIACHSAVQRAPVAASFVKAQPAAQCRPSLPVGRLQA